MSDTQSFPFQSKMHPKLWDGAFSPEERYSQLDARELVRTHVAAEDEFALFFFSNARLPTRCNMLLFRSNMHGSVGFE